VVAVGLVGFNIPRNPYYYKELDFQVSRSYGPGRYDPEYEAKGHDYPAAYVRWTENRNMEAFVSLVGEGKVDVKTLITHRFPVDRAAEAYDLLTGENKEPYLGVVLVYPEDADMKTTVILNKAKHDSGTEPEGSPLKSVGLGVIGAGNFANAGLLPIIKNIKNLSFVGIAGRNGLGCSTVGRRFGFGYCTTDTQKLLDDASINTIALLTRHNLHAAQVMAALKAGKNVFVEKPLCLTEKELEEITATYQAVLGKKPALMVGFNRRFAPFIRELKENLQTVAEPLMMHYRVNAGFIPADHWTQDPVQGGGRLLGEGCHFIDTLIFLAGSIPVRVECIALPDSGRYAIDNLVVTMQFANGSIGVVTYVANGDKSFGKEFLEVFGGSLSARLEDYRTLRIHHGKKRIFRKSGSQDKGHKAEWEALVGYLLGKSAVPMSFDDVVRSTKTALAAKLSLDQNAAVLLND
jgi:predicted dehydrogenase